MGKFAQLVIGPAGSGKSTYCRTILEHIHSLNSNYKGSQKRQIHVVNLDPAIDDVVTDDLDDNDDLESLQKKQKAMDDREQSSIYSISITDLITLQDVMEEMDLGPNGALMYCMEFFISQLNDWLNENVGDFNDDYLIFDCPGQIELYSHVPLMRQFTEELTRLGYRVATVYCMDAQFIYDTTKFMSGSLMCLSAMTMFQDCPHFNILTKCDLIKEQLKSSVRTDDGQILQRSSSSAASLLSRPPQKASSSSVGEEVDLHEQLEEYLVPDTETLLYRMQMENTNFATNERFLGLHRAIAQIISEYSLVSFLPLDITDDESIDFVLNNIDHSVQYGEDLEVVDGFEREDEGDNWMGDSGDGDHDMY